MLELSLWLPHVQQVRKTLPSAPRLAGCTAAVGGGRRGGGGEGGGGGGGWLHGGIVARFSAGDS